MKPEQVVRSWRAVEALRAGVPNRDAVQALGSSQPAIEDKFLSQLTKCTDAFAEETSSGGMLVAGDFGTGKSHLLEYLQHLALENNFVCSKVVISKETPLYDPGKVFDAAIESARVPDRAGAALTAVAGRIDFNSPSYSKFYQWANRPDNGLSSRFGATVFVFERGNGIQNQEASDRIIRFWSGGRIAVKELKEWLKELGEVATYRIDNVSAKDLAVQRYHFVPRLMAAAGYAGWVILVDEVELIGRYSLKQRARSYAQIARLMGKLEGSGVPGLTSVLSISTVFESEVLDKHNTDEEAISRKFGASAKEEDMLLASQAERGMRIIRRDRVQLRDPNGEPNIIRGIYEKCQAVYSQAYGWTPSFEYGVNRTWKMRQHIKRLINEWDLRRLYPNYRPELEVAEIWQNYEEDLELETPMEEDADQ